MEYPIDLKPSSPASAEALRLFSRVLKRIRFGRLRIILPDGSEHDFCGPEPGPRAEIQIRRPRLIRRVLLGGANGFAEGYMAGDFETPDLTAVLEIGGLNENAFERMLDDSTVVRWLQSLVGFLRLNSKRGARRNIAYHYDLGNAFYEAWLDPGLTYSSAIFDHPDQPLADAQERKYARIAEQIGLRSGDHVLEIGCGWGGFALHAARNIGCRVTGLTISQEQHDYARARIREAGVEDRVEIRFQDYRDVTESFDRVVSIEMLEAVGERYWSTYFTKLKQVLKPGGTAGIQVISIDEAVWPFYRRGADFIQRHIFPGGVLPTRTLLKQHCERAGLTWLRDDNFAADYARTLAIWHQRFRQSWPEISRLGFDERFRRMWSYYLAYCEAGFRIDRIGLQQIAIRG